MRPTEQLLPTFEPTPIELVRSMNLSQRVDRAIALLREHEPPEGYYLAFSGGKDSCAIKRLAQLAGVKFEAWYSNTTIDPPELVRFIKVQHKDVKWKNPEMPMMIRVATARKPPPTRMIRWCCEEYKESHGGSATKIIFGVRAAESARRKGLWHEVVLPDRHHVSQYSKAVCPIVFWGDDQLWEFLRSYSVSYCELYDQGCSRLGCVGCPLADKPNQDAEFSRWPRFGANWKRAIIKNWERMRNERREDGKPFMHARFKSGEELWQWWRYERKPDIYREECQTGLLWTNQELEE